MARLSASSNPTNLKEISKNRVALTISGSGDSRSFVVDKLDLSGMGLDDSCRLLCVAIQGKTIRRFELGTISAFSKKPHSLKGLDEASILKFRILVRSADHPILLASAENIRPNSSDAQDGESLLPMTPADLGQILWRLDFEESGPNLVFNSKAFPNAGGAENYMPFVSLVLPEALRQVLKEIAENPENLDDENHWMHFWGQWLDALGLDHPEGEDGTDNELWINESLGQFCDRYSFTDQLCNFMHKGGRDD